MKGPGKEMPVCDMLRNSGLLGFEGEFCSSQCKQLHHDSFLWSCSSSSASFLATVDLFVCLFVCFFFCIDCLLFNQENSMKNKSKHLIFVPLGKSWWLGHQFVFFLLSKDKSHYAVVVLVKKTKNPVQITLSFENTLTSLPWE